VRDFFYLPDIVKAVVWAREPVANNNGWNIITYVPPVVVLQLQLVDDVMLRTDFKFGEVLDTVFGD